MEALKKLCSSHKVLLKLNSTYGCGCHEERNSDGQLKMNNFQFIRWQHQTLPAVLYCTKNICMGQ